MKTIIAVIGISFSILISGCQATSQAIAKKLPDTQYIEVIPEDPATDVEASLAAAGHNYVCKEIYYGEGSPKNRRACFIKAPEDQSLHKTLGVKLRDVPEAMLEDTGKNALVVGTVALEVLIQFYDLILWL